MLTKVGAGTQSAFVLVKQSPGPNIDFSCQDTCRWGDYAGASPDPAADVSLAHGRVWLTNQWNVDNEPGAVDWRTLNWLAKP